VPRCSVGYPHDRNHHVATYVVGDGACTLVVFLNLSVSVRPPQQLSSRPETSEIHMFPPEIMRTLGPLPAVSLVPALAAPPAAGLSTNCSCAIKIWSTRHHLANSRGSNKLHCQEKLTALTLATWNGMVCRAALPGVRVRTCEAHWHH
jgi:hypothetical protein